MYLCLRDRNGYRRMKECMEAVEMSYEQAMDVFHLLAGVLLLGDLVSKNVLLSLL